MRFVLPVTPILALFCLVPSMGQSSDSTQQTLSIGGLSFSAPTTWGRTENVGGEAIVAIAPDSTKHPDVRFSFHIIERGEKESLSFSKIRKDIRRSLPGDDFNWTQFSYLGSGTIKGNHGVSGHYLEGRYNAPKSDDRMYYFFALMQVKGEGEAYLLIFRGAEAVARKFRDEAIAIAKSGTELPSSSK